MPHEVVKITIDDDGEKVDEPKWHLVVIGEDAHQTLCTGEFYGEGVSNCVYKTKTVNRGGITCPECLDIIRVIKNIKL